MNGNDRSRSVNPVSFWSSNFIDVKGLSLQFGSKTFTGFEIADLESCNVDDKYSTDGDTDMDKSICTLVNSYIVKWPF